MSRICDYSTKFWLLCGTFSLALAVAMAEAADKPIAEIPQPSTTKEASNVETTEEQEEESGSEKEPKSRPNESLSPTTKEKQNSATAEVTSEAERSPTENAEPKPAAQKKPEPFVVERKPLKIEQELDGLFVAAEMHEIAVRPEVWSRFVVEEAVPHGQEVKKGELLVRFEDEQIEDRLTDDSINLRLNELELMHAEEETPREEKLLDLAYREAKREYDQLVEDHEYYLKTDRPFAERIANYRFNSAKEDLESQREELAQLKKMYEADELTEETEAIVLRRQEFEVQTAELMVELQAASRDYVLNVSLPRNDLSYTTALARAELALERAKTARELGISRGKYQLEKKREDRAKSVRSNAKILGDRDLMELRAPVDGTVYYGRCVDGKWGEISTLSAKLLPFGTIPPNTVIMTIVNQRPLYVAADLSERDFSEFKTGLDAVITPTADAEVEIKGKLESLAGIPNASRKFGLRFDLGNSELPQWLVAGMSCKVKVTTYEKENAVLVPEELVHGDEEDQKIKYVLLLGEDDKPQRRTVELGRSKAEMVEILEGLKEGDRISKEKLKKPAAEKE